MPKHFDPYNEPASDFFGDIVYTNLGDGIKALTEAESIIIHLMVNTCYEDKHFGFIRNTSWHTIKNQMRSIRNKLHVNNRSGIVKIWQDVTLLRETVESMLTVNGIDCENFDYAKKRLSIMNPHNEADRELRDSMYSTWIQIYNAGSLRIYD